MQRVELPPPAYNATPGYSPSANEMLSPHPTHASPVSPETTGQSQQENGNRPAQPSSTCSAPPLWEPMGAAPYVPPNQTFATAPLSSPEMGFVQPTHGGQHVGPPPEIHHAPQIFDAETRKSEPQLQADLEAKSGVHDAKYLSKGQQVRGQEQERMQGHDQQESMAYPSTNTGANRVYQTAIPLKDLGRVPAPVDCPRCERRGLTDIETESGGFTHLLALALCCFFGLGCIPYCIDETKDVNHKCPSCQSVLALWHRSNSKAVVVAFK